MKILVISNLFPPAFLGGYEVGAAWVCAELRRRGHEVMIWTASDAVDGRPSGHRVLHQPGREDFRWLPAGPTFYGLDVIGGLLLGNYDRSYDPVRQLLREFIDTYPARRAERRRLIEEFHPDQVLIFNPACILDPVFAELSGLPVLRNKPHVALISDDWPLHWHSNHPLVFLWRHWHALRHASALHLNPGDRLLLALGNCLADSGNFEFGASPVYTHAAFTSGRLREKCRPATLHGVPTRVIHWGLPAIGDYPSHQAGTAPDRPLRLAFCGQIRPHKGLIRILRAMQLTARPCSLTVIGDDSTEYARFCRAYAEETGLAGRVDFTGKIPADEVPVRLATQADLLVLPSLDGGPEGFEEPFSIVLLQGMAAGLAVAASPFGGSKEAFEDGVSGRFFDPDKPAELANIIDALDADRDLLGRLGQAARRRAQEHFAIEEMVDGIIGFATTPGALAPRLLYAVRNATIDPANSGCVRVTRRLGRLVERKSPITFVTWPDQSGSLRQLDNNQAEVLGRFNGPRHALGLRPGEDVQASAFLTGHHAGGWLVLPEIMPAAELAGLLGRARDNRLRTAAIFYDAIALLQPEFCNEEIRANHAAYMRTLASCDLVIPISRFSEECLLRFWRETDTPPTRVQTVLLPGEFSGTRLASGIAPPQTDVVRLLCVSTLEPRKNHLRLLAAMRRLPELCPQLRFELNLVGNGYAGASDITHAVEAATAADDRIRWWRVVDDQRLRELYTGAHFTIYPSLIEGFGLPILESLWHERPCICSDQGVMAELARDGGCLATNVRDELCLAQAITMLGTDQAFRQRLTAEAAQRPLKTWDQYSDEILDHLHRFQP